MSLELLIPIERETLVGLSLLPKQIIGKNISIHSKANELPELKGLQIALSVIWSKGEVELLVRILVLPVPVEPVNFF